ncbi:DUF4446 family protein [Desulfotomaculum defluvii]
MNDIYQFIDLNNSYIVIGLSLLIILLLIVQLRLNRKFNEVSKKYRLLTRGPSGSDLEEILQRYTDDVSQVIENNKELLKEHEILKEQLLQCVHNPGLIRFNAFTNMGSDLSFSLAMLDRRGDGVVLTGLYGRDETRLYAKPILKGSSDYSLTEEEKKAIQRSLENMNI